jgi:hypothetical protein
LVLPDRLSESLSIEISIKSTDYGEKGGKGKGEKTNKNENKK